jgi:hypothetical protein
MLWIGDTILPLVGNARIKAIDENMQPRASQTRFNTRCYTCPNEQVRYSIALYEHRLQDYQVSQPLIKTKIECIKFCKNLSLISKVPNMSKTCQNGRATQTSC